MAAGPFGYAGKMAEKSRPRGLAPGGRAAAVAHAAALVAVVGLGVLAGCGADKKGSAEVPTPLGPINTGGLPDPSKSHGEIGLGSDANAGGRPDPKKSHGKVGNTGAANSGGAPDVSKSIPRTEPRKK